MVNIVIRWPKWTPTELDWFCLLESLLSNRSISGVSWTIYGLQTSVNPLRHHCEWKANIPNKQRIHTTATGNFLPTGILAGVHTFTVKPGGCNSAPSTSKGYNKSLTIFTSRRTLGQIEYSIDNLIARLVIQAIRELLRLGRARWTKVVRRKWTRIRVVWYRQPEAKIPNAMYNEVNRTNPWEC